MNEAQKQASKQRWVDCEEVAEIVNRKLGKKLTKHEVHNHLYAELKTNGSIDRLRATGDIEDTDLITETEGWKRLTEDQQRPKIHEPEQRRKPRDELVTDPADMLKISLWFISRFESPQIALLALQQAAVSLSKLGGKLDE